MKYFICYEKGSDVIWGVGNSKLESRKNAKIFHKAYLETVNELSSNINFNTDVVTMECSKKLYERVAEKNTHTFCVVDWDFSGGVAKLTEEIDDSSLSLNSNILETRDRLEKNKEHSQDIYLEDTLEQILSNQLIIMEILANKQEKNCL